MGFMGRKSQLKSKIIQKVWLNKKNYKFLDFDFKVTDIEESYMYAHPSESFNISVYNCDKMILKLEVNEILLEQNKKFIFKVKYFNPQTDNDCFSINHILAVCGEYTHPKFGHKDKGNVDIIKNQFIFRKRESYYSFTKIWHRGEIKEDNENKQLSYEFATDEYLRYVKKIFKIKRMENRKIKKHFKGLLDKVVILEKLK